LIGELAGFGDFRSLPAGLFGLSGKQESEVTLFAGVNPVSILPDNEGLGVLGRFRLIPLRNFVYTAQTSACS
jgi:hypothetical protein